MIEPPLVKITLATIPRDLKGVFLKTLQSHLHLHFLSCLIFHTKKQIWLMLITSYQVYSGQVTPGPDYTYQPAVRVDSSKEQVGCGFGRGMGWGKNFLIFI